MNIIKIVLGLIIGLVALVAVAWLGTRLDMGSFAVPAKENRDFGIINPPGNLPAPVERFTKAVFGEQIPQVQSALLVGKAELTFNGITLPTRFKFYYDAGKAYYHFIQSGWFGLPVFTVNERYKDGVGILDLPGNHVENDPNTNAAANQGLWAEGVWMPSIWFTDSRVRWETVDDTTARLIVPNAAPEEAFTLQFDPKTGLMTSLTSMRYQGAASTERTLWTCRTLEWQDFNGVKLPVTSNISWGDNAPWVTWHLEAVLYNVDVSRRLAQYGGDFQD